MFRKFYLFIRTMFTENLSTNAIIEEAYPHSVDPPWLQVARRELGISEVYGKRSNTRILEYHHTTFLDADSDETSWCSSFVNWCLIKSSEKGTNKANARSWMHWGVELKKPKLGCVVVLWRVSIKDWRGHCAFYVGEDKEYVHLLGGNQSDKVKVSRYKKSRVLGYRWPSIKAES